MREKTFVSRAIMQFFAGRQIAAGVKAHAGDASTQTLDRLGT